MPHWGEPYPNQLKRGPLKAALADYILQVNHGGYREVYGYCLYAFDGSCSACIERCPSKAISTAGKEVERCPKNGNGDNFKLWGYGSCGHCSTFVPCSRTIPAKIRRALDGAPTRTNP